MRRTFVAVALTSSLLTATPNLLNQIWSLFASFWGAPADSKAGFGWDPNGIPQAQPKEGFGWDPNGLQGSDPQPQAEAGCGWDPFGRCNPDPQP